MTDEIWLEKYRPQTLEEVQGNVEAVNHIREFARKGNIPNVILAVFFLNKGPPGIGKTSSILCLARHLLKDSFQQAVIELNASDDRGIDVIRETVKGFAQKKVNLPVGLHKIIILDEADSLTEGAQQALRMIISDYEDTTRFILSCNDSTKIIQPIQSRCIMLRFTKLDDQQVLARILYILEKEKIKYDEEGLEALVFTSDGFYLILGDMRQAINNLQATFVGFQYINKENVLKVCDIPNLDILTSALVASIEGDFIKAQSLFLELWNSGYNAYDLVNNFAKILQNYQFQPSQLDLQYQFMNELVQLKVRILEGLPTFIQISGFLANICLIPLQKKI